MCCIAGYNRLKSYPTSPIFLRLLEEVLVGDHFLGRVVGIAPSNCQSWRVCSRSFDYLSFIPFPNCWSVLFCSPLFLQSCGGCFRYFCILALSCHCGMSLIVPWHGGPSSPCIWRFLGNTVWSHKIILWEKLCKLNYGDKRLPVLMRKDICGFTIWFSLGRVE